MRVETVGVSGIHNLRPLDVELEPGLNVVVSENAHGKTTQPEAVGLTARGCSFSGGGGARIHRTREPA